MQPEPAPSSPFENITPSLISKWENKLLKNNSSHTKLLPTDYNIYDTNLTYPDIKTIENDCKRTRTKERFNQTSFETTLRDALIYYCITNEVDYKQGMNEIMSPFLLLRVTLPELTLARIINLFSCFLDNFLTNYYYERELFAFKSSVNLLTLLLKYHDPKLFSLFEESNISPEMYATNWLLTTNANKHSLYIVYKFWEMLIEEDDKLFIHFFVIAFLQIHRLEFIEHDVSTLPLLFSKIQIKTLSKLEAVFAFAKKIRMQTPYSFRILVNKLDIFKPRSTRIKEMHSKHNTEYMMALPFLPSEILFNKFTSYTSCVDNHCVNFRKKIINGVLNFNVEQSCMFCSNNRNNNNNKYTQQQYLQYNSILSDKDYIYVDLRLPKGKLNNFDEGTFPGLNHDIFNIKTLMNEMDATSRENYFKECIQQISQRNNKHIIIITSEEKCFREFEECLYSKHISRAQRYAMLTGVMSKINKQLNKDEKESIIKSDAYKALLVKEYEIVKEILNLLIKAEVCHVSILYEGFISMHEMFIKYNIPLTAHKPQSCKYCEDSAGAITVSQEHKLGIINGPVIPSKTQFLKEKFVDTFKNPSVEIGISTITSYTSNNNNKVFHAMLLEHNMDTFNEKIMIFIIENAYVLFTKNEISSKGVLTFMMLDEMELSSLVKKNRNDNVFTLMYNKNNFRHVIKVNLLSDADAKTFDKVFEM
jgi:hypothetical protein